MQRDLYQEHTDRLIEAIEEHGDMPWRIGWDQSKCSGPTAPLNAATGKLYRGVNVLLLQFLNPMPFLTGDPRFVGYEQAKDKGWHVRKGERGTGIVFFTMLDVEDAKTGEKKQRPMLKGHTVFHASQIDGIPDYAPPAPIDAPWTMPEAADIILKNSGAMIDYTGSRAAYSPTHDRIIMPALSAFHSQAEAAATALHELGHWTGHETRLNRQFGKKGTDDYSREELRAETASVLVGGVLGLPFDIPNHASYVGGYLKALKGDKRELFRAFSDAQKIADYQLTLHPDYAVRMVADRTALAAADELRREMPKPERAARAYRRA